MMRSKSHPFQAAPTVDCPVDPHQLLKQFNGDPEALAQHACLLQAQLEEKIQLLQAANQYIARLKQQIYGSKSDRLTPEQQAQLDALAKDAIETHQSQPPVSNEVLVPEEEEVPSAKAGLPREKRPARVRRHPTPVKLEVVRVVHDAPESTCAHCQQPMGIIGEEITTEYDFIPARLIVREIVRPKKACRCGQGGVSIAALPARLLPQSKLGLGLAVHILLCRFDDHVSYYNLERNFLERHGIVIPRQQMVQWVEHMALLMLSIYNQIWEDIAAQDYVQIDETPVKVLDPEVQGKSAKGYLWFYCIPHESIWLEYCPGRGRIAPEERLKKFTGTIQTDGYEVYESIRKRRPDTIKRVGCLAHARRHFHTAANESLKEAAWFIEQMRSLYGIEEKNRQSTPEERKQARLKEAPATWRAMKRRAEELAKARHVLPKGSLGKAARYFLKNYQSLVRYMKDGRYQIDNNLVENSIRPVVIGRKRWLFLGHPDAGWRSAVIYTLIQNCRIKGINPQEYLTDVLKRLPSMTNQDVKDLVPARWKPANTST